MVNETKTQEFNKSIKQLQQMVSEKQLINLAEKYYNLKTEMSGFARTMKEKESALVLEEAKKIAQKPEIKEEPQPTPKLEEVEIKVEEKQPPQTVSVSEKVETKPNVQQQNARNNQFSRENAPRERFGDNRNNSQQQSNGDFRNRPYNNQNNNPNYRNNDRSNNQRPYNAQNQQRPYNPNFKPGQNNQGNRPYNNQQRPFNPNFKPGQRPNQGKDATAKRPSINYAQPVITASPTRTFANKKKENERFEEKRAYSKRDLMKRGMLEMGDEDRVINRKVRSKKKEMLRQ